MKKYLYMRNITIGFFAFYTFLYYVYFTTESLTPALMLATTITNLFIFANVITTGVFLIINKRTKHGVLMLIFGYFYSFLCTFLCLNSLYKNTKNNDNLENDIYNNVAIKNYSKEDVKNIKNLNHNEENNEKIISHKNDSLSCGSQSKSKIIKNIISYQNDILAYDEILILENISLTIQEGKFTAFIGESGVGKTSLINRIANDLDFSYTFLKQDDMLVGEVTLFDLCNQYEEEVVINLASKLDIVECLQKKAFALSGGQKIRGRILINTLKDVDVYIFDEPTQGLDNALSIKVFELLDQLKLKNKTIIVSTHDQNVSDYCDQAYVIKDKSINLVKNNHLLKEMNFGEKKRSNSKRLKTPLKVYISIVICYIITCFFFLIVTHSMYLNNMENATFLPETATAEEICTANLDSDCTQLGYYIAYGVELEYIPYAINEAQGSGWTIRSYDYPVYGSPGESGSYTYNQYGYAPDISNQMMIFYETKKPANDAKITELSSSIEADYVEYASSTNENTANNIKLSQQHAMKTMCFYSGIFYILVAIIYAFIQAIRKRKKLNQEILKLQI